MTTPTPAGWLIDDSPSFNPYWLAYSEKNQSFVDTFRARGKRVVTMWAGPDDLAQAYEATRLKVAELERIVVEDNRRKNLEVVPCYVFRGVTP